METEYEQIKKMHRKGAILALTASILWGFCGIVQQYISQDTPVPGTWFIGARTITAGTVLLLIVLFRTKGKGFFDIFKSWKNVLLIVGFATLGLLGNMYSFFYSIKYGNASATTILQYLAPLFILLGTVIFYHKMPTKVDFISFFMALVGVALLITRGNFNQLAISPKSFWLGIVSGLTAGIYYVLPHKLNEKGFDPIAITGWGMFIGGIVNQFIYPTWKMPKMSTGGIIGIATVILLGTIGAFLIMVMATKYTTAAIVSITDAVQPVATFILSLILLHTKFNWVEVLGGILIIIAIYILNRYQSPDESIQ